MNLFTDDVLADFAKMEERLAAMTFTDEDEKVFAAMERELDAMTIPEWWGSPVQTTAQD